MGCRASRIQHGDNPRPLFRRERSESGSERCRSDNISEIASLAVEKIENPESEGAKSRIVSNS